MSDIAVFCAHTEMVETAKLVRHPRNPNRHPESQIALLAIGLAKSYRRFATIRVHYQGARSARRGGTAGA
jgi:hypothetical protein